MNNTEIKPGYVYHIKDIYFDVVKDDNRSFRELLRLHRRGVKIVFPNITRLENTTKSP